LADEAGRLDFFRGLR